MKILAGLAMALVLYAQSGLPTEEQIRTLYDAEQWDAVVKVTSAVPSLPASVLFYRGLSLARLNKLNEAADTFQEGIRRFPEDKRFPLELAGVEYREKSIGTAKKYLRQGLRLDASDEYGNDFLGSLYLLDSNLPAALKYWNRINKPLLAEVQFAPVPSMDTVLRERAFPISPGQIFSLNRLMTIEGNLSRLNILAETRFELLPQANQQYNLLIRSVPFAQPLSGWLGTVLPMLRGLPYQSVNLDFYNIDQRAINLTSLWRWDPNKRRVALQLSRPVYLNPKMVYHLNIDVRDENWDLRNTYYGRPGGIAGLLMRKGAISGDVAIGLTNKLQWTVGAEVARRDFRNGDGDFAFRDSWSAEMKNRFDYALWSWPERKLRMDSWALLRTGRILTGSPSRLISMEGGVTTSWIPQAKADTYSVTATVRGGKTFGTVPLDELFMLGMERDNDLWLRGLVGTRGGRKGNAPLGREYGLLQMDMSRRLFQLPLVRIEAGPFFDSGWIGDPSQQFGSRQGQYASGIQGQVKTLGGVKVKLVYGWDLRSGSGVFYTAISR